MEQKNTAGSASGSARTVVDRVRSTATSQLSNQKDRATDGLGSLAQAVRRTAQPLREEQQDTIAQYVDKAADHIERLSSQLREKDITELMDDAQRFARRQPAVFIGTAFALGIVAARFLKSTGERQKSGNWQGYGAGSAAMPVQPGESHLGGGAATGRTGYPGGVL